MRGVLFAAACAAGCLFSVIANSQPLSCDAVQWPVDGAAFLIDEGGARVEAASLFHPAVYLTSRREAAFRVCVPVPSVEQNLPSVGTANIRIQFYNALEDTKESPDVEYYNSVYDLRLKNRRDELQHKGILFNAEDYYFSTSIARYQEFHGCGGPFDPLERGFHMDTPRGRTDGLAVRQKFLFTRDATGACGLLALADGFRRLFDWRLGSALAADLYDFRPDEDRIVRRRSVIVSFDVRARGPAFASYLVEHIGIGKCIRVESTLVFDPGSRSDVELVCVGPK